LAPGRPDTVTRFGKLDILVNMRGSASTSVTDPMDTEGGGGSWTSMPRGSFPGDEVAFPHAAAGSGANRNISSIMGFVGGRAAIRPIMPQGCRAHLHQSDGVKYGPDGIRATPCIRALCPPCRSSHPDPAHARSRWGWTPLRRLGQPRSGLRRPVLAPTKRRLFHGTELVIDGALAASSPAQRGGWLLPQQRGAEPDAGARRVCAGNGLACRRTSKPPWRAAARPPTVCPATQTSGRSRRTTMVPSYSSLAETAVYREVRERGTGWAAPAGGQTLAALTTVSPHDAHDAISLMSEVTRCARYSVKIREHEYRSCRWSLLILGKNWHRQRAVEQSLAFFPRGCCSPHPKAFAARSTVAQGWRLSCDTSRILGRPRKTRR